MLNDHDSADTEVDRQVHRRHFTVADKLRLLAEYSMASDSEKAEMCRRERVSTSTLASWSKKLSWGKPSIAQSGEAEDAQTAEVAALRDQCAILKQRLLKAYRVIDSQEKVCAIWRAYANESGDAFTVQQMDESTS